MNSAQAQGPNGKPIGSSAFLKRCCLSDVMTASGK